MKVVKRAEMKALRERSVIPDAGEVKERAGISI